MADKKYNIILSASDETRAAFDSAKRGMQDLESPLLSVRNAFNAVAASAVVASIYEFGKAIANAAEESYQAQLKLQAVYKATGGVVGFTADALDRMADSVAGATHFDDEAIRNGMSEIIKFGTITGAVFKDSLQVIADYATFSGQEFPAAATAVAKALADPESAAKLLKQAGVVLTESQKDLIKEMKAAGDEAGAQQVILERLQGAYSGMEETLNSGLTGATRELSKEWNDLLESMGKTSGITVFADHALSGVAAAIKRVRESIDDFDRDHGNSDSILFNRGKGAPLQLGASADTGPLADKTIADVQAANAAIAAAQATADAAADAATEKRMKKLADASKKQAEKDDEYWIEKAKKEYERGETHTTNLIQQQQERFVALSQAAQDADATDEERAVFKRDREMMEIAERQARIMENHLLTEEEEQRFQQALADIQDTYAKRNLDASNQFHMALDNFKNLSKISQLRILNEGMLGEMALAGTKYRAMFELTKIASTANAVVKGWEAATASFAFGAEFGGPIAGAAMAAISIAATAAQISAIQGASFGGGMGSYGAGGGPGGMPITTPSPLAPLAPEPQQTAQRAQGIIINVNLGDDTDMPGANYVRKFIVLLNEQIHDGAVIDQIRVS